MTDAADCVQILPLRSHPKRLGEVQALIMLVFNRESIAEEAAETLTSGALLPQGYFMLKENRVIGWTALIQHECVSGRVFGWEGTLQRDTVLSQELSPWISPLLVHPDERGHGYGRLLLEHARKEAGRLGYTLVYLTTGEIGYYEKYGFREVGLTTFTWGRPTKVYEHDAVIVEGGASMQVTIKEAQPITVIGYASRHRIPGVTGMADIPAFWNKISLDYGAALSTLHHTYTQSFHCEIAVCLDVDEEHDCFTYMLGVGVDQADAEVPQRPGTYRHQTAGGLYAVFTTPPCADDDCVQWQKAWRYILDEWLPGSEYEFDDARTDFEYYDERDHTDEGNGIMDIYVPIRKRQ